MPSVVENISDEVQAKLYQIAADRGDPEARYELGLCYAMGKGVPQSDRNALIHYKIASEQGNNQASTSVALAYSMGHGTLRDADLANKFFLKAARQGTARHLEKSNLDRNKRWVSGEVCVAQNLNTLYAIGPMIAPSSSNSTPLTSPSKRDSMSCMSSSVSMSFSSNT